MLGLVTIWWAGYARVVRGLVLALRERPYVEAARSAGASRGRILGRHILPGVLSPVIVLATLDIGQLVLVISGLTFLGLGAPPPTPEWGAMLNDGRVYFLSDPHVVIVPGIAISLAVLASTSSGTASVTPSIPHRHHRPQAASARGQAWPTMSPTRSL